MRRDTPGARVPGRSENTRTDSSGSCSPDPEAAFLRSSEYQFQYKVKRRGPITQAQKANLNDLVKYHKIELDVSVDSLTKNEASRKIDTIIARYGRIKR